MFGFIYDVTSRARARCLRIATIVGLSEQDTYQVLLAASHLAAEPSPDATMHEYVRGLEKGGVTAPEFALVYPTIRTVTNAKLVKLVGFHLLAIGVAWEAREKYAQSKTR